MQSAHETGSLGPGGAGPIRIGPVELPGRAFLAPMSGVTDAPFRRLAQEFGAGLVVSEMVASAELVDGNPESVLRMEGRGISPHVVQLAGREARWMGEGARRAVDAGADIVDINMGCPARKVTNGWSGSALMRDLDAASRLIEATVEAVGVPVTLKMRLGWDWDCLNAPELAQRAERIGVRMITVHGRTRCDFYRGQADWTAIRRVSEAVSVPVIANGDIADLSGAREALLLSGAQGVMVGRGAYGRPWIVGAMARALKGEEAAFQPPRPLPDLVCEHYEAMLSHYGAEVGSRVARKHLGWYLEAALGEDRRGPWRARLCTEDDPRQVLRLIPVALGGVDSRQAA